MTGVDMESAPRPPLSHILETCIYVRDLRDSTKFYRETLGIASFGESVRTRMQHLQAPYSKLPPRQNGLHIRDP
jgi:catechol 2,3-dioxygenase-like lactoylglutathione lyase family enzyme